MGTSLTGDDGVRVSPLFVMNLKSNDDGLKVRCNIAYQADTENHFFGGTVTSSDMVLKIAHITEFKASNVGPVKGDTITLTCLATGKTAPTFKFSSPGRNVIDHTFYEEVKGVEVSSDGTTHTAKYTTKALAPNVLRDGQLIECEVSCVT